MRRIVLLAAASAAMLAVAGAAVSAAFPHPQCPPSAFVCPAPGGGG